MRRRRSLRTHRAHPSAEVPLRTASALYPARPAHLGLAPRGGAGPARPEGRRGVDRGMCPVRQPASCVIKGWKWNASALVRPCHADAQSASLREKRFPRYPRVFPARPSPLEWPSPRRGGLRTPATTPLALLERVAGRPPALRLPLGRHAIPGLACGLSTRAHRVRPSEETSLRPGP
jgi:hypothetical protein